MAKFKISVIMPTYNRADSLRAVLQSMAKQTLPSDQFEVIVVDDGSKDDTALVAVHTYPFRVVYLHQKNQGAAVARNRGASIARGEVLVFLDDDIPIVPDYLCSILEGHLRYDKVIIIGNLQPYPQENNSIFHEIYRWETATPPIQEPREYIKIDYTDCLTGMFSVKCEHFFSLGMLQDLAGDGRVAWGDVDFGYRAYKLGFQFLRSYQAIGYHNDFSINSLGVYTRRMQAASRTAVKLFHNHPDILPRIPMFEDKTPIDWKTDSPAMILRKITRSNASMKPVLWSMEMVVKLLEHYYPSRKLLEPLYRWVIGSYIYRGYREGLRTYGPIDYSYVRIHN